MMAATSGTQFCGMQQLHPPPKSTNTVKVRMIDTTCVLKLYAEAFLKPVMPGHEIMTVTDVCFLIENPRLGKKAMFDLGVRKDYWNSPPWTIARIEAAIPGVKIDKDVTEILQEKGMKLDEIGRLFVSGEPRSVAKQLQTISSGRTVTGITRAALTCFHRLRICATGRVLAPSLVIPPTQTRL